jgi:uncharacterized protein YjaG (DUF416 family)
LSEEKPRLEDVDELLRDTYEKVEEVRVRLGALVKDLNSTIERLEEGLKQNDEHMVNAAVDELKTLVKYLDKTIYGHILGAVVKVSEAGLKLAELVDEERKKAERKPEAKPIPPPSTPS